MRRIPIERTHDLARPLAVSWIDQGSNALPGARHAAVRTLYSRAHRIGLDGASCLLDGLRKSISFDFSVVVIVCVLVCPPSEVVILAEEQLQGFGDHVGRRSVDKLSVQF